METNLPILNKKLKTKIDWITYISFMAIVVAMLLFTYYNFTEKVNECTSDPLRFAVDKIKSDIGNVNTLTGSITITTNDGGRITHNFGDEFDLLE